MPTNRRALLLSALTTVAVTCAAGLVSRCAPAAAPVEAPRPAAPPAPVSIDEARRTARQLQAAYEATLHVIHRRYFDQDEKHIIPARALEEVFEAADEGTGRTSRWIAVSTPAMNVDHDPRDGFEKQAAEALRAGKPEFESVEGGLYRRAGAVTLFASCLRCHESGLTKQIAKKRVAAFVVSVPVLRDGPP